MVMAHSSDPQPAKFQGGTADAEDRQGLGVLTVHGRQIRVRGTVQGVGFRPTVWRIARELGLAGDIANDAEGVLIRLATTGDHARTFATRIKAEAPALAKIDSLEISDAFDLPKFAGF